MPSVSTNINDQATLKRLAATQYLDSFKRQSLTSSEITAQALARPKTNLLHISLHKTGNLNEFHWQLTIYDALGANILANGNITRISDAETKLNIGTLNENILNCSISKHGRLVIRKLHTSLDVLLESDVKIRMSDLKSSGAVFIRAPKSELKIKGSATVAQEFIIESNIVVGLDATIFSRRNLSIITSKLCDIKNAKNITSGAILKIYAPQKIDYDLTKLIASNMVDITLNVVDDLQLISDYGSNLTYEVLSPNAASRQIIEDLNFTHNLHIISPQVTYEIGSNAVATKIFSSKKFALEAKSLKLQHGALFTDVLGLKIHQIILGHIHTDIIEDTGLYKVNAVFLGCNKSLTILDNDTLLNLSGEIDASGKIYLDVNRLTTIGGRLIAGNDVYFAGNHIELTIKKQETGEDVETKKRSVIGSLINGYDADEATERWVSRTCKILTTEPVVRIYGELHTTPAVEIINHCGHVTTKTANLHNVTLRSEASFTEYKVRVTNTHRYSKRKRIWGIHVDNRIEVVRTTSDRPLEQDNLIVHMATAQIYGSGELNLHSPTIDGLINAPHRYITVNGVSQIGQSTARYNEMLANIRPTSEFDYRPGLLFGIAAMGSGSIYQALAPISMPELRSFKILVLDNNSFHVVDQPNIPFEYSPVQQAYNLHRMFEIKYNYTGFPGQEMGKEKFRTWLHNNALLFNHESEKVDNLTPFSALANLIRPIIYFKKVNILLPDNTMREGLRLEPVLPAFMLKQESSLTGLNVLIKDDCNVTSAVIAHQQILLDITNGKLTVQKLLSDLARTVQNLTVARSIKEHSTHIIHEKKIATRGLIEAQGISGTVQKLHTIGADFNLGTDGMNIQSREEAPLEEVHETSYRASASSGYIGRDAVQTFEHLATHKVHKTTINSAGPIKIEVLLGDILDKGSVFNSPATIELQAHRGQVIKFLAECLKNDTPVAYAQERAKNWLQETFTKKNLFHALTIAFAIAGEALQVSAVATAGVTLAGAAVCAVLAVACHNAAQNIAIKELNQAEAKELARLSDKKSAEQIRIVTACATSISANSLEHKRSRDSRKFAITKDASSIEELDALNVLVGTELSKVDNHFHGLQGEIIQQTSNRQEELEKIYQKQVKSINDRYEKARKKCKAAPGPSAGVGLAVNFGSTGSQVNATTYFTYRQHTSHGQATLADFSTVPTNDSWSNRRTYNDHTEDRPFREDIRRDDIDDHDDIEHYEEEEEVRTSSSQSNLDDSTSEVPFRRIFSLQGSYHNGVSSNQDTESYERHPGNKDTFALGLVAAPMVWLATASVATMRFGLTLARAGEAFNAVYDADDLSQVNDYEHHVLATSQQDVRAIGSSIVSSYYDFKNVVSDSYMLNPNSNYSYLNHSILANINAQRVVVALASKFAINIGNRIVNSMDYLDTEPFNAGFGVGNALSDAVFIPYGAYSTGKYLSNLKYFNAEIGNVSNMQSMVFNNRASSNLPFATIAFETPRVIRRKFAADGLFFSARPLEKEINSRLFQRVANNSQMPAIRFSKDSSGSGTPKLFEVGLINSSVNNALEGAGSKYAQGTLLNNIVIGKNVLPQNWKELHEDLIARGFKRGKDTARNYPEKGGGTIQYKNNDGVTITIKDSGEVIRVQKKWTSDGSKKYPERQDYFGNRLPDQSHSTGHFVEAYVGPAEPKFKAPLNIGD